MTNKQKRELRTFAREGLSFDEIRPLVDCVDSTIKQYIKVLSPKLNKEKH